MCAILKALGFAPGRTSGGHQIWKGVCDGRSYMVPVSTHINTFNADLIQQMCGQAGSNRKAFYGATPGTAIKIR